MVATSEIICHCHILEHEDHAMMRQLETTTVCGDGARGLPLEACDDGNTAAGDGCSPTCSVERANANAAQKAGCGCGASGGLDLAGLGLAIAALLRRAGVRSARRSRSR